MSNRKRGLFQFFRRFFTSQQPKTSLPQVQPGNPIKANTSLKLETILIEEYKYLSRIALQILQDRSVTLNFYFILAGITGTIVAGILGAFISLRLDQLAKLVTVSPILLILMSFIYGSAHFLIFTRFLYLERYFKLTSSLMNDIRDKYIQELMLDNLSISDIYSRIKLYYPFSNNSAYILPPISMIFFMIFAFLAAELVQSGAISFPTNNPLPWISAGIGGGAALVLHFLSWLFILHKDTQPRSTAHN